MTVDHKPSLSLLPIKFTSLDSQRYVVTSETGQYVVADRSSLLNIVNENIDLNSPLACELIEKNIVCTDLNQAIAKIASLLNKKAQLISQFTGLHIFVVTLRCEHSCPYCQVSRQTTDTDAFDMSEATAMKALDFTFQTPSPCIKIEFQGGEPLLNFDLIQKIVLTAEKKNLVFNRQLRFVIATNLALVDDKILDFCREHDIHISTSLDGPADLHRANRPRPGNDSYEKVIQGIAQVRRVLGPNAISALMTTTEKSLSRVKEIIDEYIKQGFSSIFLRPLSPYGFAIKTKWYESYDVADWLKFYFEGLEYILELNKQGEFFAETYAKIILEKMFHAEKSGYVDLQSPTGLGISVVVFNYDGDVYASDESRMLAEMGDKRFLLGNLYDMTYKQIMLSPALLKTLEDSITESVPLCNECAFEPFCGSDPVYHYATQKDVVGNKILSGFCKKNMAIFRYLITKIETDREAKKIFMNWITH